MGFRFRLEKILELRRSELDQRRASFLALEREGWVLRERLSRAEEERAEHGRRSEESSATPLRPLDLLSRARTSDAHRRRVEALAVELHEHQGRLARAREELAEANQRVRMLEKLREKKLEEYRDEIEAQERKILDDIQGRKGLMRLRGPADPARSQG